jgi:hypothetical protein
MSTIIITGNPVDGFKYHGPFDTPDSAIDYEEHVLDEGVDWWIAPLVTPEPSDSDGTFTEDDQGNWRPVHYPGAAIPIPPTWEPTHVSKKDGSTARYSGFGDAPTFGYILLANENGDEWSDRVSDWEALS